MDHIKIAAAQFENKSGDKKYNLSVIRQLSLNAASEGAHVISFHECSITGYTFARHLKKEELLAVCEEIPEGDSIQQLISIAKEADITILAGLFEKDKEDNIFKAMVCVDKVRTESEIQKAPSFHQSQYLTGK